MGSGGSYTSQARYRGGGDEHSPREPRLLARRLALAVRSIHMSSPFLRQKKSVLLAVCMTQKVVQYCPSSTADQECAQHSSPQTHECACNQSEYLCSLHLL